MRWRSGTYNLLRQATILMTMLWFLPVSSTAQQTKDVSIRFKEKAITAANQELINLTIKINNTSEKAIVATAVVTPDEDLELVSRSSRIVRINPGDSLFLPIKLFVTNKAQSSKNYKVIAQLLDASKNMMGSDVCPLEVVIKKSVNLFPLVTNILLQNVTDSIRIPIRVQNQGNTSQRISLVINYPTAMDIGDFQKSIQFIIPAGTDTLIHSVRSVNKKMMDNEGFDINIAGLYANGELFVASYVRVQNAKNKRSFQDHTMISNPHNNSITIGSQGLGSPNNLYLFLGRGMINLPKGSMEYNFDLTLYDNRSAFPSMLRNTFVGYEVLNMGIRAGNITKNMEINIMGKGGEFYLLDTTRDNRYEAGYIKNSVNLLGEPFQNIFSSGDAAWGTFSHTSKQWNLRSGAIYQNNNFLRTKNMLLTNQFGFNTKSFQYSGSVNAGRIDHYQNSPITSYGYAGSVDIFGNINNISISSSNFISSKYYPGSRQGSTYLSQQVMHTRGTTSAWLNLDYYRSAPANTGMFSLYNSSFDNLNAEVGISYKFFKKLTIAISPNYRSETNDAITINMKQNTSATLRSWNLGTTLNLPISLNQYISLNSQVGYYNSTMDEKLAFHSRINANYRYRFFNLNSSLQQGSFYVGEIVSGMVSGRQQSLSLNVSPSIQHAFFKGKLKIDVGLNYYSNNALGRNTQINGRTEFEVLSQMLIYGGINNNSFYSSIQHYQSNVFEVGITKKLKGPKFGKKNGSLQALIFKDVNQNGIYDAMIDSVAPGFLVHVNDVVFISGKDGMINYKNLPIGEYRIGASRMKGWYTPEQRIKFEKTARLEIPLQKTGTIKGLVAYDFNEFSYEIGHQKEGLIIIAESENGQNHITRTNADGTYLFFIPTGKYKVRVSPESLPPEISDDQVNEHVELTAGEVKSVSLVLNVKQRKIETKRFSSPSLRK